MAGRLGGRYIEAPPGRGTRPTAERVREAWFSALGERVRDAAVVDLFAGSGALGIEALSRGARSAHFVEADRRAAEVLRANLRRMGVEDRARLTRRDVFAYLADERTGGGRFDLALADPPYGTDDAVRLVEAFVEAPFASLLCVEHAPGALGELALPGVVREGRYGDSALTFIAETREP